MKKTIFWILVLFNLIACRKSGSNLDSNSQLTVTVDPTIGSVMRTQSSDTFAIDLKDPSICPRVPVVLHMAASATSSAGTKVSDSVWNDTIDISQNKVAMVTITAQNRTSRRYGLGFKYIFTAVADFAAIPPQSGSSSAFPEGVYVQGNTIYVATRNGIFISTNGGASFANYTVANGLGDNRVLGIYVQGNTIYASTYGGLSMSTDGGIKFTNYAFPTLPGSNDFQVYGPNYPVASIYAQGNTIYAATFGGVEISTDGGTTFTKYTNGLGSLSVLGIFATGNTIYAATAKGLSVSLDGGNTFTNSTNGLGTSQGYYQCNGVYEQNGIVYVATVGGLSISTDGGAHFSNLTIANGLGDNWVSSVYLQGNTIYAATNGGLSISTDGGTQFTNYSVTNGLGQYGGTGSFDIVGVFAQGNAIYTVDDIGLNLVTPR